MKRINKRKLIEGIDTLLRLLWSALLIGLCFCICFSAWKLYHDEEETAAYLLNVSCLYAIITASSFVLNILIIPITQDIIRAIDKKRHPEKYKPITQEQIIKDIQAMVDAMKEECEKEEEQ